MLLREARIAIKGMGLLEGVVSISVKESLWSQIAMLEGDISGPSYNACIYSSK